MINENRNRTRNFTIEFDSCSENEAFARGVITSFVAMLDPSIGELTEIKTAVSEAVSNCIIHGYRNSDGRIHMSCDASSDGFIRIIIRDDGMGIDDVEQAMMPLFTTGGNERSGMGFTVMESFMDRVTVNSSPGKGTEVILIKKLDVSYV